MKLISLSPIVKKQIHGFLCEKMTTTGWPVRGKSAVLGLFRVTESSPSALTSRESREIWCWWKAIDVEQEESGTEKLRKAQFSSTAKYTMASGGNMYLITITFSSWTWFITWTSHRLMWFGSPSSQWFELLPALEWLFLLGGTLPMSCGLDKLIASRSKSTLDTLPSVMVCDGKKVSLTLAQIELTLPLLSPLSCCLWCVQISHGNDFFLHAVFEENSLLDENKDLSYSWTRVSN